MNHPEPSPRTRPRLITRRRALRGLLAVFIGGGILAGSACSELTAPRFPEPDEEVPDPNEGEEEG